MQSVAKLQYALCGTAGTFFGVHARRAKRMFFKGSTQRLWYVSLLPPSEKPINLKLCACASAISRARAAVSAGEKICVYLYDVVEYYISGCMLLIYIRCVGHVYICITGQTQHREHSYGAAAVCVLSLISKRNSRKTSAFWVFRETPAEEQRSRAARTHTKRTYI